MRSVRLSEAASILAGQHIMSDAYDTSGQGTPYLTGPADFGDRHPTISKWTHSPRVFGASSDVLVTVKGNGVGKVNFGVDAAIGRQLMAIRPNPSKLDRQYLFAYLRAREPDIAALGRGATVPGIGIEALSRFSIPLPPLDEQRRIAAILDHADALRAKRRASLAKLDSLTQSIFQELFGHSTAHAKSYQRSSLAEVVYFQEGPGVRNWQFRTTGIKLINVRNIVDGELVLDNTDRHLDPAEVESKYSHFLLDEGDLVLASSGVTWGKVADVRSDHLPLCLNTSMIRVRPRDVTVSKAYLRAFLESSEFRSQIDTLITGSAQPNFGPSHLKLVLIPLPPTDVQTRYDHIMTAIRAERESMRAAMTMLDSLFASLQHRAFRGDL